MSGWWWHKLMQRLCQWSTLGGVAGRVTTTPGRAWNGLSFEEAKDRWLGRVELPEANGQTHIELSSEEKGLFVEVNLDLVDAQTGEILMSQCQWLIEKCSGDVWSKDDHAWELLSNVYGRIG